MRKKWLKYLYIVLLVIVLSTTILIGCSANSNKINIKTDKLRFNEETGDKIKPEFGTVFFEITKLSIDCYNIYIENPEDERIILLKDELSDMVIFDMPSKYLSKSLKEHEKYEKANKDIIEYEEEIFKESILMVGDILIRVEQDEAILKEEKLREKNLKDMDDEKFNKLKDNKEEHINTIKENIMKILEKYYEF